MTVHPIITRTLSWRTRCRRAFLQNLQIYTRQIHCRTVMGCLTRIFVHNHCVGQGERRLVPTVSYFGLRYSNRENWRRLCTSTGEIKTRNSLRTRLLSSPLDSYDLIWQRALVGLHEKKLEFRLYRSTIKKRIQPFIAKKRSEKSVIVGKYKISRLRRGPSFYIMELWKSLKGFSSTKLTTIFLVLTKSIFPNTTLSYPAARPGQGREENRGTCPEDLVGSAKLQNNKRIY